jgi:YjbE family integral membrane protein
MQSMLDLIAFDLAHLGNPVTLTVLVQVLVIDVALAGENAIVVGSLAAALPREQRAKVVAFGVIAALILRILFALVATQLLQVVGLVLAGGILLLWVAWKMWREMRAPLAKAQTIGGTAVEIPLAPSRSLASAARAIALADVSMSLDNVLGVAGAAKSHPGILIIGLFFSVALMGVAANIIARFIDRYRWIAWIGIAIILWVACTMIVDGLINDDIGLLKLLAHT